MDHSDRFVHFVVPPHMPYTDTQFHLARVTVNDLRTPCGILVLKSRKTPLKLYKDQPKGLSCCNACASKQTAFFGYRFANVFAASKRQAVVGHDEYAQNATSALFK